uniref:Uncharacterized protein n=1 Tax=Castor canadensis TaxID=51338 RepID=A0A8C0WWH3_CASCN
TQPAKPGPDRAGSRGWAWAPAATAPPTRTREESEPHPLRRLRTYLQGTAGLLDSGHGPEGRSRGGRNLSQGPQVALGAWDGAGRGETLGALPRARVACRGGRGDLALPLAPGHRRRRHFAFHFVSPPPHSAVGFPDVGISRRRLRGAASGSLRRPRRLSSSLAPAGDRHAHQDARFGASRRPDSCLALSPGVSP